MLFDKEYKYLARVKVAKFTSMTPRLLRFANTSFILLLFAFTYKLYAQDTIITYQVGAGTVSYSLLPAYDTTISADSLPAFIGIRGSTAMPLNLPTDTFPGTLNVSRPFKAADYYSSFNF